MKPNYLTILITTLCIFFNACHNSNTAPQLQLADSLIDKRADSALCILEKLSIEEISNKSAKAMNALLLTEALDKNFKSHRNDSLILIAVDYYKDNSNNKLKTKAYYYLGRVYQDNKEYIKATEAYLTALKTASPNQAPYYKYTITWLYVTRVKSFIFQLSKHIKNHTQLQKKCKTNMEFYTQSED